VNMVSVSVEYSRVGIHTDIINLATVAGRCGVEPTPQRG
jgi:hypothetical protein